MGAFGAADGEGEVEELLLESEELELEIVELLEKDDVKLDINEELDVV